MRALYVSLDSRYDSVSELHDHSLGEWGISPREASDADLLVPVVDGRPVGVAWQIRGAIHGVSTTADGAPTAIVITMGHALSTEGIVPDEVPAMHNNVAVADLVLAA